MQENKVFLINYHNSPELINGDVNPKDGGLAHIYFLAQELAKKYDVSLLVPGKKRTINHNNLKIRFLGNRLKLFLSLPRIINKEKPSAVISGPYPLILLSRFINKQTKSIGIVHDIYNLNYENKKNPILGKAGFLTKTLERATLKNLNKLDHSTVVNHYVKDQLVKKYSLNKNKVSLVGNGVKEDMYGFVSKKKDNSILFIGRLVKSKKVTNLLNVMRIISEKNPEVKLTIIGNGPLLNKLKDAAGNNVIIKGYLTEKEKIKELQKAKVYVSLSKVEGFGIPLVEAMACGAVPVISDIKAHEFVLQRKKAGILVKDEKEMAKKVEELLNNEKLRKKMSIEGRKLVEEKWTWKKVAGRYDKIISSSFKNY